MDAVSDRATGEVKLSIRPLSEVRKGYTSFGERDVLWAKITPCMENGKTCIVHGLSNGVGFGSTEFHVLRPRSASVIPEYILAFMSQQNLRRVARFAFTGSAGHQRVPEEFITDLPFPVPPVSVQQHIAEQSAQRRNDARRLAEEAEGDWQASKRWLEAQLLG